MIKQAKKRKAEHAGAEGAANHESATNKKLPKLPTQKPLKTLADGGDDTKPQKYTKSKEFQKQNPQKKPGNAPNLKRGNATGGGGHVKGQNKFAFKTGKSGASADGGGGGGGKFGSRVSTNNATEERKPTDWREFKQQKKELLLKRKKAKSWYEVSAEAKQIYEKLKCRRTEKKPELVEELYKMLSKDDVIKKLVMAHDTARIIQCMLKFAAPPLREQLSEQLLPLAVDMAVSKYSHFCVLRMFKYGSPNIKSRLVDSFAGHIVKLACHSISSKILDHAYITVASAKQKAHMKQEFYGELYRNAKDDSVKALADCYRDSSNMKASILGTVKSNLEHVANKQLMDNSLVHAVALEYLTECEDDKVEEAVTMLGTLSPLLVTTKDGCQTAIICFYKSTPKNRRAIIKVIKEHLVKMCTHEHGHIFIVALLNALDDTKATKKAIYDTLHPELQTLLSNQWGRRVVEWFVSPADTNCFHPTFIAAIEEGLQYGKKDKELRRKEIFEQIEEPIALAIAEQPEFWLSNRHVGLVTAEILRKASAANFVKAASALATIIVPPTWTVAVDTETPKDKKAKGTHDVEKIIAAATELKRKKAKAARANAEEHSSETEEQNADAKEETESEKVAGIEEAGLHIVLKKIIKHDKELLSQSADADTFGSLLIEQLTAETLEYWLTVNRACFVLLNIVENNNESTTQKLKELLKPHCKLLKKQTASGAQLLLKKLAL